jgi:hypothetical protein
MNVHPLFPQHIVSFDLKLNNLEILNLLKSLEYTSVQKYKVENNLISNKTSEISSSVDLFNEHFLLNDLKKTIIDCINVYTKEILSINYNFKFSSSWATRTKQTHLSTNHHHKNSFISGVYYPSSDNNSIMFSDFYVDKRSSWEIEDPKTYNLYNSSTWTFSFKENTLILFQSYLDHSILENKNKENRYSLAFNTIPIGKIGIGDSAVCLT